MSLLCSTAKIIQGCILFSVASALLFTTVPFTNHNAHFIFQLNTMWSTAQHALDVAQHQKQYYHVTERRALRGFHYLFW